MISGSRHLLEAREEMQEWKKRRRKFLKITCAKKKDFPALAVVSMRSLATIIQSSRMFVRTTRIGLAVERFSTVAIYAARQRRIALLIGTEHGLGIFGLELIERKFRDVDGSGVRYWCLSKVGGKSSSTLIATSPAIYDPAENMLHKPFAELLVTMGVSDACTYGDEHGIARREDWSWKKKYRSTAIGAGLLGVRLVYDPLQTVPLPGWSHIVKKVNETEGWVAVFLAFKPEVKLETELEEVCTMFSPHCPGASMIVERFGDEFANRGTRFH
ncbi:hypothetical protein F4604DRAFT_1685915 [Suillus subluteus]|nr:hypothetical protein F4604DRAFT_1685915 [Suillus subluteus]